MLDVVIHAIAFGAGVAFIVAWGAGLVMILATYPDKFARPYTGESMAQQSQMLADLLVRLRTTRAGLVFKRGFLFFAVLFALGSGLSAAVHGIDTSSADDADAAASAPVTP